MTDLDLADTYLNKTIDSLELCRAMLPKIISVADIIVKSLQTGNKIFFCGNGGSAAQSQHLAAEFCGRFLVERPGLPALSLTTDTSAITAIANDIDYSKIFEYQAQNLCEKKDLLIIISSSGNSKNITNIVNFAKKNEIKSIGFSGFKGGSLKKKSDISIHIKANNYGISEDAHHILMHVLLQYLIKYLKK